MKSDRELLRIDQLGIPNRLAGFHVDGDQSSVDGADIKIAEAHRQAAVVRRMGLARDGVFVEFRNERPQHFTGGAVDGEDLAVGTRIVKDSVLGERRRLKTAGGAAHLLDKRHFQFADIVGVDLAQRTVVPRFVAAVERLPVLAGFRKRLSVLRVCGCRQRRSRECHGHSRHQFCSKNHCLVLLPKMTYATTLC